MDPVTAATLATVVSAGTAAATTVMQSKAQSQAAEMQGEWAQRQALEEKASSQASAAEELRRAQLAKSRLMATAGASGSGVSDPTVLQMKEGIQREGEYNAAVATSDGDRKANHMTYQAALDRWTAKSNERISNVKAAGTLIGGVMEGRSRMALKYGGGKSGGGTGY